MERFNYDALHHTKIKRYAGPFRSVFLDRNQVHAALRLFSGRPKQPDGGPDKGQGPAEVDPRAARPLPPWPTRRNPFHAGTVRVHTEGTPPRAGCRPRTSAATQF